MMRAATHIATMGPRRGANGGTISSPRPISMPGAWGKLAKYAANRPNIARGAWWPPEYIFLNMDRPINLENIFYLVSIGEPLSAPPPCVAWRSTKYIVLILF